MLDKAGRNGLITAIYLMVQIALPLGGFLLGSPYFGWRMFSEVRIPPRAVVTRTGSVDTVSVNKYVGFARGDLSYGPDLATQICRIAKDAITVHVLPSRGPTQVTKCH
jgi:hypothetical protein